MTIERFTQTDSRGRTYPVFLCDVGHWHRGLRQAQTCKAAQAKRVKNAPTPAESTQKMLDDAKEQGR